MIKTKKLVSIIVPCFNAAAFIKRFIYSIIFQTYKPIELIIVDDGSEDNTATLINDCRDICLKNNVKLVYLFNNHSGQAAAINVALPIFSGDYLMWADCDDIMLSNNVEEKVNFLENHNDKEFVLCQYNIVLENDLNKVLGIKGRIKPKDLTGKALFKDLIEKNNIVYGPGTILAKRSAVLTSIPTLSIYESKAGQNYQLILPLAYMFEYGLIEKPLMNCVLRDNSHSHSYTKYNELRLHHCDIEKLIIETLKTIPTMMDLDYWTKHVKACYARIRLKLAYEHINRIDSLNEYSCIKAIDKTTFCDYLCYFGSKNKLSNFVSRFLLKILNIFHR